MIQLVIHSKRLTKNYLNVLNLKNLKAYSENND